MLDTAYWHTDCHSNTTKRSRRDRNTARDRIGEREGDNEEWTEPKKHLFIDFYRK